MPLSKQAQKSLDDSARINAQNKADRKRIADKNEADRLQAEKEYNDYIQQEAELKKQIETLTLQEAQEQKKIDDFNLAEAQRIANLQAQDQAEKDRLEKIELDKIEKQKALSLQLETARIPYETEIKNLEQSKSEALTRGHTQYWADSNLDGVNDGGTRAQGVGRSQFDLTQNIISKNYNSKIEAQKRELSLTTQKIQVQSLDIPQSFITKAIREYGTGAGFTTTSISTIANRYYQSFLAQSEQARQSSITTAKSNAVKAREEYEKTVRQYETNRDSLGVQLNEGQIKILNTKTATQASRDKLTNIQEQIKTLATKKRPEIKDSSFFKGNENSVIPTGIKGTTKEKSIQAQRTLKEIEAKQKKLELDTRTATSSKETIKIRQQARELDPYVGTANTYLKKGGITSQAGVLVDLKLDKKYEQGSIDSKLAHPETLQTYKPTSKAGAELISIPKITKKEPGAITEYEFIDNEGNKKILTQGELFSFASYLIDQKAKLPSKVDQTISNYRKNNPQAEQGQQSGEITNPLNKGFAKGFLDTGTEISATVQNIGKPEGKKLEVPETLEGVLFTDLIGQGSKLFGQEYNEARTSDYIKEKIKTPLGIQELAGSAFGASVINYALLKIPGLLGAKVVAPIVEKIETKQIIKIAEKAVKGLQETTESIAYSKKLKQQFPEMPEAMIKKLSKEKEKIVGYELLDSRTALIKRGTETGEELTPYVVVRLGKNARSTVYATYTAENPGAFKNILVSGKQTTELSKGVKITDDIKSYPANRDNILKTSNEDKLAKVGTKQNVGQEGFIDNPKLLIEKLETQKVTTGDLITETERISQKGKSGDSLKEYKELSGDKYKGQVGSKEFDYRLGTDTAKTTKPKQRNFLEEQTTKTKSNKIELPSTKKSPSLETPIKSKPNDRLEKFIKSEAKGQEKIRIEGKEYATKLSTYSASAGLISTRTGIKTRPQEKIDLSLSQTPALAQRTRSEISTELKTKQDINAEITSKLKGELETVQKQKPYLDPKYSLIVSGGQQQDTATVPAYRLITKQKPILVTPVPEKTILKPPPIKPGFTISLDLEAKKPVTSKAKGGRVTIGYFRYNTNTESVGRDIPGLPGITTGKSKKVITKIDQLERRINTPQYAKKRDKKEKRSFLRSLVYESRYNKGSLDSKGFIPNISEPKGKKAKKALKKFSFKLNF